MTTRPYSIVTRLLVCCAAAALWCAAAQAKIVKGPYLQNLTQQSVTVCFETDRAEPAAVEYRREPAGEIASAPSAQADTFHEITLTGLQAGTEYKYKVTSGDDTSGGGFVTAPDSFIPFTFAAYGDTRTDHVAHKQVSARIKAANPVLILNSGDLVDDGTVQADWDAFWNIVSPLARSIPYYPTLGNHEKNSPIYYRYFSLPDPEQAERQYAFTYAGVYFIALDSTGAHMIYPAQMKWLKEHLKKGQAYDHIFVMFHEPLYSSSKREPNLNYRKALEPLFKKAGVTAVFNGHDHFYERSMSGGIAHIVTGGGGAPLYDHVRNLPESVTRAKAHHFVKVSINGKKADFQVIGIDGTVIDEFSVTSPR